MSANNSGISISLDSEFPYSSSQINIEEETHIKPQSEYASILDPCDCSSPQISIEEENYSQAQSKYLRILLDSSDISSSRIRGIGRDLSQSSDSSSENKNINDLSNSNEINIEEVDNFIKI